MDMTPLALTSSAADTFTVGRQLHQVRPKCHVRTAGILDSCQITCCYPSPWSHATSAFHMYTCDLQIVTHYYASHAYGKRQNIGAFLIVSLPSSRQPCPLSSAGTEGAHVSYSTSLALVFKFDMI